MKLLMIIAGDEFAEEITSILIENGFIATNIGSSGDFLQYGYTVLMVGAKDEEVEMISNLLKHKDENGAVLKDYNNEVSIHVVDIDKHVKLNEHGIEEN